MPKTSATSSLSFCWVIGVKNSRPARLPSAVEISTGGIAALRALAFSKDWRSRSRMKSSTRSKTGSFSTVLATPVNLAKAALLAVMTAVLATASPWRSGADLNSFRSRRASVSLCSASAPIRRRAALEHRAEQRRAAVRTACPRDQHRDRGDGTVALDELTGDCAGGVVVGRRREQALPLVEEHAGEPVLSLAFRLLQVEPAGEPGVDIGDGTIAGSGEQADGRFVQHLTQRPQRLRGLALPRPLRADIGNLPQAEAVIGAPGVARRHDCRTEARIHRCALPPREPTSRNSSCAASPRRAARITRNSCSEPPNWRTSAEFDAERHRIGRAGHLPVSGVGEHVEPSLLVKAMPRLACSA